MNLKGIIQEFKARDPVLYRALDKFADEIEGQSQRLDALEKEVSNIEQYCTGVFYTQANAQPLTAGAWTPVNFQIKIWDGDNLHFTTAAPKHLIKRAGFYIILGCVNVKDVDAANALRIVASAGANPIINGTTHDGVGHTVCAMLPLPANSDVQLEFFTNAGANTLSTTAPLFFGIYRLPYDTTVDLAGVFL